MFWTICAATIQTSTFIPTTNAELKSVFHNFLVACFLPELKEQPKL